MCVPVCESVCAHVFVRPPVPVSGDLPGFRVHLPPSILHPPSVTATDGSNGATGWGWGEEAQNWGDSEVQRDRD